MKKAGIRHMTTCSLAYHLERSRVAEIAVVKRTLSRGIKNTAVKTTSIHKSIFISFL
jgi:hypothetical protein